MKHLLTLLIVAVLASTSFAQETATKEKKGAKKAWQVKRIEKLLAPITLTAEQEASFGEAAEKLTADLAVVKQKGLTNEMFKAREDKRKEGRKSGLKGKDLMAHVADGVPAEEVELFATYDKTIRAFEKTVASMLTDEQMGALPEKVQKKMKMVMKEKRGKGGKGKKKKKAADEADSSDQ